MFGIEGVGGCIPIQDLPFDDPGIHGFGLFQELSEELRTDPFLPPGLSHDQIFQKDHASFPCGVGSVEDGDPDNLLVYFCDDQVEPMIGKVSGIVVDGGCYRMGFTFINR